jgi:arsenate reductase (glutaredoxin)
LRHLAQHKFEVLGKLRLGNLLSKAFSCYFLQGVSTKVYLYEKCGTCQDAMKWLDVKEVAYTAVPIKDQPPSRNELQRMLGIYGGNLRRLFNTSGLEYKRLNLKTKLGSLTESEALDLLAKNGMLVKRPFVLTTSGGAVGFKEMEWAKLFP